MTLSYLYEIQVYVSILTQSYASDYTRTIKYTIPKLEDQLNFDLIT